MNLNPYGEISLVEEAAIALFGELGWETISAKGEVFGQDGTLGRETKGDVVLTGRLLEALTDLNPGIPIEAILIAIDELIRDRSSMSAEAANLEIYGHMKEGIPVSIPDVKHGGQKVQRLKIVDWKNPENNDFLLVSQFKVTGNLYTCIPDLVGFVNGLPWVLIELKKPGVPARAAYDDNITHYKQEISHIFWYNAMVIASNGTDSRVGSLTSNWERFSEWKRIEREDESRRVSLEVMLRGTCEKTRLFDLAENFTLFSNDKGGLVKILGQNHQYLGVNNAISSMLEARQQGHGRGGVFWQTQGSGKSFSMVFLAQKILRKIIGNWTFVIVTDRVELDEQIAKTFKSVGAVTEGEGDICHASSGEDLRQLLRGNHRYVFTLVHKFQTDECLTERSDVIVLTDEAHRSQYNTLALNMRAALPNAMFLAFTGTPLIDGDERTKEVFGDYVSIYDFQQSVEDGATVPLFYENRTPELELVNPNLNDQIYKRIEEAELDTEQEEKLEKILGKQIHIITRDDRLETIAKDIVHHFLSRGFIGKAMVVSIDKPTALKMHNKVQFHWTREKERVEKEVKRRDLSTAEQAALRRRMDILRTTDMALIVSPEQNEIERMRGHGLNIEPHRKRMRESQPRLDEKFKDTSDSLRLVFVCAMWLTGFDAPSCSTLYLDKPMRNHTLMQTIARANRVFPGKHSGLIVDYSNVFESLKKALAIYGAGKGGKNPVRDKKHLVLALREAVESATSFCESHGVNLKAMEALKQGSMDLLAELENGINALIHPENLRKEFLFHEKLVSTLFRAVKPDSAAVEFSIRIAGIRALAGGMRAKLSPNPPDISAILTQIDELLDESITGLEIPSDGPPAINLSKVNFEALSQQFKESKHQNIELEALKAAIAARLKRLIKLNPMRTNFSEKFETLIESYNNGSRSIEQLFQELLRLSGNLSEEEERHVRENLSEEELVIFDILTRPSPELTIKEREDVKKVAKAFLKKLKDDLLVLNWRKKSAARSKVVLAIEDSLDTLPKSYDKPIFDQKCSAVFEHVYESYPERNIGIYAKA
jgi:type I restriction enzyme R subunit